MCSEMDTSAWRRGAVAGIKVVHTSIFALISACILHVFVAGLSGRSSRWTGAAVAIVLGEVVVFTANGRRCPLTGLAEAMGAEHGEVADIFLPRWFADRIPLIATPPALIGVTALLWRRWRKRQPPDGPSYQGGGALSSARSVLSHPVSQKEHRHA